jgi:hypothetical protein
MGEIIDKREYVRDRGRAEMLEILDRARIDVMSGALTFVTVVGDGPHVDYAVAVACLEKGYRAERLLAAASAAESAARRMLKAQ